MNFDLNACHIRPAKPSDRDDLIRVSRGIWGGTDYLPRVMDRWISEPWFLVCEYQGRVIACLKLSLFPDQVLWFEGLRVQTKYQNRGIATLMNKSSFALAEQLRSEGKVRHFEFCTYYLNSESLHLTQKLGFKVVETFFQLNKRGIKATQEPKILPKVDLSAFRHFGRFIPCSWQSVHHCPDALPFLNKYGRLFQTPRATYYLGGAHEPSITLLDPPGPELKAELPYFQYFFGSRKSYGIILPPAFKNSLPLLHQLGFHFWDHEEAENMLILSL